MFFSNKFYIIFHFISLCAFISIQNTGRSIPLRSFIDKNDFSQVHDVTGIVPKILKALLMIGRLGKVICFNVELTPAGTATL